MSEEQLPFIKEIGELIATKIEFGEFPNDVEYILTSIKEEIKMNMDKDYSSEDEKSDSETDEEDLIKEKITFNKTDDGFFYIEDNELDCDRIGRKRIKK
tara:strand:- start:357 stop:653 length:297 start_codon:yes stop_codon:yes gene_type:complete